ncbi:MAG: hypothetical protein GX488_08770 [Clostridiales bacterium]|nr:hypothetical protein [Clostridiales bacterium]
MPMQDTEKKLEAFTDTIIAQAIEEAHGITEELRRKQEELIKNAEAEIAEETERYQKAAVAEIKAAEEHRISAQRNKNKHAILEYREACAVETYKEVADRIKQFTASDEYLSHLKKLLKKAIDALGYGFSAEVYLREEDMHFADELLASVSGVSLAFCEGDFSLGGLRLVCPSMGKRIDMSFDTALNDMIGHFTELTGLNIGE